VIAVKVNNDGNRNSGFSCGYGNNEKRKEESVELVGPNVFVERNEVDVHAVQNQLHTHQQGDQVSSCKKPVHASKKQAGANEKKMIKSYGCHERYLILFRNNLGLANSNYDAAHHGGQ
jgi:hypothetical protein